MALAGLLQSSGEYELASTKYTHAGEKVEAMKCLIKAGKTEVRRRVCAVFHTLT